MIASLAMRTRSFSMALAATLLAAHAVPSFLVTFAGESRAEAMTARAATLRELVTLADLVVEGTPEESKSLWEEIPGGGRRIVTYSRVSVSQVVYGAGQSDVWVRTLGGTVGNVGQRVEGESVLVPGERAVFFLKKRDDGTHAVAEMSQGHYLVKQADGAQRLHPSPHLGHLVKSDKSSPLARELLVGKAIDDASALIRAERKAAGL